VCVIGVPAEPMSGSVRRQEVGFVRKKTLLLLIACIGLGAVVAWAFLRGGRRDVSGHPLVGHWSTEPGALAPHNIRFRDDGTGQSGSGVGNFHFRWRLLAEDKNRCRINIRYENGKGYGPADGDEEFEFLDPDTVRERSGVVLRRQR
jgi:hypothetical protein